MIQKETYLLDNIQRIKDKYNLDPELIQRAIFALGLVETLVVVGAEFIFKGGSSLMILNETPKRLSTDVDILVEPDYDIESFINKASSIFPFISFEESKRKTNKTISKKHFRIKYASPRTDREVTVIVDVLFANNRYKKIEKRPIKNDLLICSGEDIFVKTPSVEEMLADKLTAFAPHTIGVNFFNENFSNDKRLEVIKQFYDVSNLFDIARDFKLVKETYLEAANEEISFRDINSNYMDCLLDSFNSALTILSWGRFYNEDFNNYVDGIKKIESHIVDEKFNLNNAYLPASKIMLLSACILKNVDPFTLDIKQKGLIKEPPYNKINRLIKIQPEAFNIAVTAIDILERKQ